MESNFRANSSTSSRTRLFIFGVFFLTALSACSKEEKKQTDLVTFKLRGEVVSIEPSANRITIAHEEIPNYMMAMTMPFKVKDTMVLSGIEVGDTVEGTLVVSRTESWVENLTVVGKGEPVVLAPSDVVLRRLYRTGEPLPDFPFTNQEGKRIRLSDFRGKALAFTFIYTRCPLPDFCIRMSNHFAKVQQALAKEAGLRGKWQLLTISFDPDFDTPAVLKRYGQGYGADFSTWEFASGEMESIRKLADGLDLTLEDDEGGLIAHNLRTVLVDARGNLAMVFKGNDWTPEDVVREMRTLIRSTAPATIP